MRTRFAFLIGLLLAPLSVLSATDLNQQTVKAWDEYIGGTNARMQQRLSGTSTFLWIDEAPGRRERVRQGEILVEPENRDMPERVPQGLIHDWIGAVFIPNATIESVFAVLDDYNRYDQFFNPAVVQAKLLDKTGPTRKFSLVLAEKAPFVNAAIASEYAEQTIRVDKEHWFTISYSTRIQQIDDFGQPGQHELPPDQGTGYVWRLYSIERFEESDGGVYAELEAIALSRNIPVSLEWLVRPIVRRLPRNSMVATLQKTRNAVCAEANSKSPELAKLRRPSATDGTSGTVMREHSRLGLQQIPVATSFGPSPN